MKAHDTDFRNAESLARFADLGGEKVTSKDFAPRQPPDEKELDRYRKHLSDLAKVLPGLNPENTITKDFLEEAASLSPSFHRGWQKSEAELTAEIKWFRQRRSGFLPEKWWTYQPGKPTNVTRPFQWQINQQFLREAWDVWLKKEPLAQFDMLRLLTSVFDPANLWTELFPLPHDDKPKFASVGDLPAKWYPYQKAVLYINEKPWRAGLCKRCGKRFVVRDGAGNTEYCSLSPDDDGLYCSSHAANARHLKWWHEKGKFLRQQRSRREKSRRKNSRRGLRKK